LEQLVIYIKQRKKKLKEFLEMQVDKEERSEGKMSKNWKSRRKKPPDKEVFIS
jgi:hypothetical protein